VSAYKSAFTAYKTFIFHHFGPSAAALPPSLHHLSTFIAHCFLRQLAASTTRTLVSSLSFTFQLGWYHDISQHFIIRKMLSGLQKTKPSAEARLPITPPILLQLVQALYHTTSSAFLRQLLTSMFVLAFCAFLRVGEITNTPTLFNTSFCANTYPSNLTLPTNVSLTSIDLIINTLQLTLRLCGYPGTLTTLRSAPV
jgi:hypothetical protein